MGTVSTVEALLKVEAHLDRADSSGWTAIILASSTASVDCIEAVVEVTATVNAIAQGWTALHMASAKGHVAAIEALV